MRLNEQNSAYIDRAEMLRLEECAVRAWPAETMLELDGWLLRSMRGITRRANSVWAGPVHGALPVAERLARVEAFYSERGLPTILQLTPVSEPAGLDELLEQRGYVLDAPVVIQTAATQGLAGDASDSVQVQSAIFEDWFAISARAGRFASVESDYRGLLDRLGNRAIYALARVDNRPAAVGLGVWDGAYCGIFSMLTLPPYRRRGLAAKVVQGIARNALERGAHTLYLQVERENQNARALYKKLGFQERYGYHYRVKGIKMPVGSSP